MKIGGAALDPHISQDATNCPVPAEPMIQSLQHHELKQRKGWKWHTIC
jgi:hypothetical protein